MEKLDILSLSDRRLIKIDPSTKGFFDNVCRFKSADKNIQTFVKVAKKIKKSKIKPFWKPIYDPSLVGGKIIFKKGENPARYKSFYWWYEQIKQMNEVQGKKWKMGNEYQYYAFLIWLINKLIKNGWSATKAMNAVVLDSKELGNYSLVNMEDWHLSKTGSCDIVGVCDLANTFKFVRRTKVIFGYNCGDEESYFLAGGCCGVKGEERPLATLFEMCYDMGDMNYFCTAWMILE